MSYVVRLKEQGTVYGPFAEFKEAGQFASFLTSAVDPAEVLPVRSPVLELLTYHAMILAQDNASDGRPDYVEADKIVRVREACCAADVPLRDRYGFAASDEDIQRVWAWCIEPLTADTVIADRIACGAESVELAEGSDTPLSQQHALTVVQIVRAMQLGNPVRAAKVAR